MSFSPKHYALFADNFASVKFGTYSFSASHPIFFPSMILCNRQFLRSISKMFSLSSSFLSPSHSSPLLSITHHFLFRPFILRFPLFSVTFHFTSFFLSDCVRLQATSLHKAMFHAKHVANLFGSPIGMLLAVSESFAFSKTLFTQRNSSS